MQIRNISGNNPTFKGILNNKLLLKSLEKISEHGTSFSAGVSLAMALSVRPLAILATPDVEKENKQYACANSIASGLIKFGIVEAVALPIENAVKKIDKNPQRYLKTSTIENLKNTASGLTEAKSYKFATQLIKLGTGLVTAIPKSMLTLSLIPILMDKLYHLKVNKKRSDELTTDKNLTFTGNITKKIPKSLAKILNNTKFQNFVKKYESKDKDIAKHITAATDILLTSSFAYQTNKSSKIKENRKKALIYNNVISTAITLGLGYAIDKAIKNKTEKFIEKFSAINKGNPKLGKYIEGIHIVRPALIFAGIYYGILPIFSTFIAEKIDKHLIKHS